MRFTTLITLTFILSAAPVLATEKQDLGQLLDGPHGGRKIHYSIDAQLQKAVERIYYHSKIRYGAFVALDPATGQVLSMVSRGGRAQNLATRASFPAASIFKLVTAAAALETGKLQHDSRIPVRGDYHKLARRDVLAGGGLDPSSNPRFAKLITLEDALALSVNSVFGKIGAFGVGAEGLLKIAHRFGFGVPIPFDLPVETDQVSVPKDEDQYSVAEFASGYSSNTTLSPLHGALIAAAVANGGVMMEPALVARVESEAGATEYEFQPKVLGTVLERGDAAELGYMMHKTIVSGTSSRHFRNADEELALAGVFIAGKTGTHSGSSPRGLYDWFVGFAERDGRKIALAVMSVHSSRFGLKASSIARRAFENYFSRPLNAPALTESRERHQISPGTTATPDRSS